MYQDKKGLWRQAVIINGKRKVFSAKTKKDLMLHIALYEQKHQGIRLNELADEWIQDVEKRVTFNTMKGYSAAYKKIVQDWSDTLVADITPQLVLTWLKKYEGLAQKTITNPKRPYFFSLKALDQLNGTITVIRENTNRDIAIEGILVTRYSSRTVLSREVSGLSLPLPGIRTGIQEESPCLQDSPVSYQTVRLSSVRLGVLFSWPLHPVPRPVCHALSTLAPTGPFVGTYCTSSHLSPFVQNRRYSSCSSSISLLMMSILSSSLKSLRLKIPHLMMSYSTSPTSF